LYSKRMSFYEAVAFGSFISGILLGLLATWACLIIIVIIQVLLHGLTVISETVIFQLRKLL